MFAPTPGDTYRERIDGLDNIMSEHGPLMTPGALSSMPYNQVLYLFANKRMALIQVTPYYENVG